MNHILAIVEREMRKFFRSPALMMAKGSTETRAVDDFTGEFSSGAPVYRLPSLSVIGHREADVSKTQRVDDSARSRRPRAWSRAGQPRRAS